MTTWQIEPLGPWTRPVTEPRASSGRFSSTWQATLDKLLDEIDRLNPCSAVAVRIDVQDGDVRRDGMLRAKAKVGFPGVAVSFDTVDRGALTFATDAYEQRYYNDLPGWQANLRAIALSLEALRAVDRYGCTQRGEQYVGWRALPAGTGDAGFDSPEAALRWLATAVDVDGPDIPRPPGRVLYRTAARRMHPDAGGDPADWARLDVAHRLLKDTDLW